MEREVRGSMERVSREEEGGERGQWRGRINRRVN